MSCLIKVFLLGCLLLATQVHAVGLMPTPILTNARITADAIFDQAAGTYTYAYTVSNPASNTGEIWNIKIDISADGSTNGMANKTWGLTLPSGLIREDFATALSDIVATNNRLSEPWPLTIVPFGSNVPPGWWGDLGIDSVASFNSGNKSLRIAPGSSLGGFQLVSYGVPTIRNVQLIPFWVHVVTNHDKVSTADRLEAGQIERDIIFHTVSLGPSGVGYGSFAHWNQLRDDLVSAVQLGWISDKTLASTLTSQLATARQSMDAKDFYTAKILLQPMLATISQSTPAQRTSEGYALVYLNVQSLINNTPNNQIEPKVSLTPKSSLLSIGGNQILTVTVIDLANGSVPLGGVPISFKVDTGPNAGEVLGNAQTDTQGIATITDTSILTGTDSIIATAKFYGGEVVFNDKGIIIWSGGPDLVVPLFSPPLLITKGGRKFFMSEETQNIGNVVAPASVTRYYISATPIVDIMTAIVLGERSIPALQPGKSNSINQRKFHMPTNLPVGTYYLAACADANNTVVELNENNNCSFSQIEGHQSFIVPVKRTQDANQNDEDDDEGENKCKEKDKDKCKGKDHRDDRDSSESKDDWILGKPFEKSDVKQHKEAE